ncbi:gastrin/cholecystokinin type B receptor-like [Pristis pectinata]|uniref:gastrin/cholecystokinin type B receptor-like n=1 Tax=Pristis pectinata TaxID=685728 RepID=UPI00223D6019|nr:gastrin/cholecystokinin type B receptor-like [Pristis pectinata]
MNVTQFSLEFLERFPRNFSLFPPSSNLSLWETIHLNVNLLFSGYEPTTIVLEVVYSLSFIIGFVGNIMALRALTRKRRNRLAGARATRSLLINLSACDMMVVCICMPVTLGHQVYNAWVFGDFMCRAVPFVQAVAVSASVLSLAVISLNRYYSVHNPLNARAFFTCRRILAMICAVWLLSSALCMPLIFMNKTENLVLLNGKLTIPVCAENWPDAKLRQGYNFLLFCALYGFPVLFNLVICFLTARRLWGSQDRLQEGNKKHLVGNNSRLKARKKIVKMVVVLVLLFALSWLPLYVIDIWIDFRIPDAPPDTLHQGWILHIRSFAQWLGLTNSSLNPLCYCFIGNVYRSVQKIKKSYRQRISSVFNLAMPQAQVSSSVLLQYRAHIAESEFSDSTGHPRCSQTLTQSKSLSSGITCVTSFD